MPSGSSTIEIQLRFVGGTVASKELRPLPIAESSASAHARAYSLKLALAVHK